MTKEQTNKNHEIMINGGLGNNEIWVSEGLLFQLNVQFPCVFRLLLQLM